MKHLGRKCSTGIDKTHIYPYVYQLWCHWGVGGCNLWLKKGALPLWHLAWAHNAIRVRGPWALSFSAPVSNLIHSEHTTLDIKRTCLTPDFQCVIELHFPLLQVIFSAWYQTYVLLLVLVNMIYEARWNLVVSTVMIYWLTSLVIWCPPPSYHSPPTLRCSDGGSCAGTSFQALNGPVPLAPANASALGFLRTPFHSVMCQSN